MIAGRLALLLRPQWSQPSVARGSSPDVLSGRSARCVCPPDKRSRLTPLAHRLLGKHLIDQQGRALDHAPRPAAGAKAAPSTTERHQVLSVARVAAHPQKAMLQASAAQVVLEFPLHLVRQRAFLLGRQDGERRVALLDDLVEQRVLGPVALVRGRAAGPLGSCACRRG
jgi:hypothetical protein